MRQLTSLDTQFLALEDRRHVGHVAGLAILDPSTAPSGRFTCREVKAMIRERLALLPPLRWRVAEVPFNPYPLYLFNELALEAKLPDAHSIHLSSYLAHNELIVQSKKEYDSELVNGKPATSTLKLIFFGPIRHTFDATGYRARR